MKTIRQSYWMKATPQQVFKALTDPKTIQKWSGAPAEMNASPGGFFSMMGGQIHGTNVEIVRNKKLVQDWTAGNWPEASRVTFTLAPTPKGTRVNLLHEGVPNAAFKSIDKGWDASYLGVMRRVFAAKR